MSVEPFPKNAVSAGDTLTPEQVELWQWTFDSLPTIPYSVRQLVCEAVTLGWWLHDAEPWVTILRRSDDAVTEHEMRIWHSRTRFTNAQHRRIMGEERYRKVADTSTAIAAIAATP